MQALAILYKPNVGYIGPDNVVVDVDFHMGGVRRITYRITVRFGSFSDMAELEGDVCFSLESGF